jgi:23S rRNA maturation mini-RNase III
LRIQSKKPDGICLAFCGDAVWLMSDAPQVTRRFDRPKAKSLYHKRKR